MLEAGKEILAARRQNSPATDNNPASTRRKMLDGKTGWLRLPTEVWELIASFLCHSIGPAADTGPVWDRAPSSVTTYNQDILALASTCRQLSVAALPTLYHSPFLVCEETVNASIESICRNNGDLIVPGGSEAAGRIRSLYIAGCVIDTDVTFNNPKRFCTCELHILFSFVSRVHYLSIATKDVRNCDCAFDWDDNFGFHNHPFVHFLSRTTKCRPLGLTWSFHGDSSAPLLLSNVTSYEPLSQLRNLELVNVHVPLQFYSFLAGDSKTARDDSTVQSAIEAGFSPCSVLERLQFSGLDRSVIALFDEYFTDRSAFMRRDGRGWNDRMDEFFENDLYGFLDPLCFLATNACNFPNLKLLVLGVSNCKGCIRPSTDLLKSLLQRGVLQERSNTTQSSSRDPDTFATSLLYPLFQTAVRSGDPDKLLAEDNTGLTLQEAPEDWRASLAFQDQFWQRMHSGKQKLLSVWNGSRAKNGRQPTEVRVVISGPASSPLGRFDRRDEGTLQRCMEEFYRQAKLNSTTFDEGLFSSGNVEEIASGQGKSWRDQDVFSLVESMPWLSYRRLDKYGCCWWTGDLPRDSNPDSSVSSSGSNVTRLVLPPLIKLESLKPNEPDAKQRRPNLSRRARKGQEGDEDGDSKKRRTESGSTQQAGPSRS